jgi:hypothetical protein
MNQMCNLMNYAYADDFEGVGSCLILFFVKGNGKTLRRDFAHATSATEAKRIIKAKKADGYRLCWKSFGHLYLPSGMSKAG